MSKASNQEINSNSQLKHDSKVEQPNPNLNKNQNIESRDNNLKGDRNLEMRKEEDCNPLNRNKDNTFDKDKNVDLSRDRLGKKDFHADVVEGKKPMNVDKKSYPEVHNKNEEILGHGCQNPQTGACSDIKSGGKK